MNEPSAPDTSMKVVGGVVAIFIWFASFFLLSAIGFPDGMAFMIGIFVGAMFNHLWVENHRRDDR